MEGDREVVREGDNKKKKRGWFSRDKTVQDTKNVQRPPSSLSLPRHSSSTPATLSAKFDDVPERVAPSSQQPSEKPDDVSERVALSPPQPSSPGERLSGDSVSSIPIHAGFDFKAIRDMLEIEGAKGNAELKGMQIPSEVPHYQPAISVTLSTSKSTSPTQSEPCRTPRKDSSASELTSNVLLGHVSDVESKSGIAQYTPPDLAQTLTQSLSLHDTDDRSASDSYRERTPIPTSLFNPLPSPSSRPPSAPTLSFGSSDGSLWTSSQDRVPLQAQNTRESFVSKSPFATSTDTLSFGGGIASVASHPDPFASSGLSFGTADGAISSYGDPWVPKEGVSRNGTNPWG